MRSLKLICVQLLLVLLTLNCDVSDKVTKIRSGVLSEVEANSLQFSVRNDRKLTIGFTCEPGVCESVLRFSVGDNVIAKFGSENGKNKLISIRNCLVLDPECVQVVKEMEEDEKRREAESEKWLREKQQCSSQMQVTLASDKRYIPYENDSSDENYGEQSRLKYNSLLSDVTIRECMEKIVSDHQRSVLEACMVHRCGENVGGGCYHIAGYSIHSDVSAKAVSVCENWQSDPD